MFDDFADHAELVGPLRTHPFVFAHQSHPQRSGAGEHAGHPDQLARGNKPDADVRVEERRLVGGDHDVAGSHPVETGAEHNPLIAASTGLAIVRNGGVPSCGASHCS